MSFNHYFQSELLALKELGQDFSRKNPALAPFLSQDGRDPDVERLFEGFAFIAGRLRQKVDDELPELSHSLLQLLWPNYLRPVPSFGIVEFAPVHLANQAARIPKNAQMHAKAVHRNSAQFCTCYDTELTPMVMQQVTFSPQGEGGSLQFQMCCKDDVTFNDISLSSLRFHFTGDKTTALSLYFSVLALTSSVALVLRDEHDQEIERLPVDTSLIQAVGFALEQRLQDYPLNCFDGYLLLQEYFCFPQKYLFVDVGGLDVFRFFRRKEQAHTIELQFQLKRTPLTRFRPKKEHVRLNCTPVANVYRAHAIPLRYDQRQTEYKVIPSESDFQSLNILSVDQVTGWLPGDIGVREFSQFESFRLQHSQESQPCYRVRYKPGVGYHATETWLSFTNLGTGGRQAETVSVELTCCDHTLSGVVKEGDIAQPGDGMPQFASFRNITALSATYPPPMMGETLWRIISNMSLNYQSLADKYVLQVVLETYDFPGFYDEKQRRKTRKMLDSIVDIRQTKADRIWQGLSVRGIKTELTLDEKGFLCDGDLYLFATILNELFGCFTSLNTFHQLQVNTTNGVVYAWAPRMNQQILR